LVVITIIMLISVVALPVVLNQLSQRQVDESARILQAAIAGARDNAIRANEPRGVRFLPDPALVSAPVFNTDGSLKANRGTSLLAYNRMVQIEPAADYQEGKVTIGPMLPSGFSLTDFPPAYPVGASVTYPVYDSSSTIPSPVLMLEESPYVGGYLTNTTTGEPLPNSPTSWYWNLRVGDKIRLGHSGLSYTVVGPCLINPTNSSTPGQNPELFVNTGAPGTDSPLKRNYYYIDPKTNAITECTKGSPCPVEFLFLVNNKDDNKNGYIDEGWDGFDNDYDNDNAIDELDEWETETWQGTYGNQSLYDNGATNTKTPTPEWANAIPTSYPVDLTYTTKRRPVPTQNARETLLPGAVVIDATSWNGSQERSRLPIDPNSLYVDFMVNSDGQVIPQTIYSTPVSFNEPFFHFWLTDRKDVVEPLVDAKVPYTLPMPVGTNLYPDPDDTSGRKLTGERRLVSVFTKSGLIITDTIERFEAGESIAVNAMTPFFDIQTGAQSAK